MRKPTTSFLSRPALLCAALALGTGCETTKPRAASPTEDTSQQQAPQPGSTPDASTPEPPPPAKAESPWQRARVGDRVTYNFSAHRALPGKTGGTGVAGVVTVEVVAVEASWVWLTITSAADGGTPLKQPVLARALVVPMRSDVTRPLKVEREQGVVESAEQLTAAGRTWEAKRYLHDRRPADGPLENRLYAVDPGPVYLTNGLLDASTTLSGFGASGSTQLTLVEARQGGASAGPGTRPSMERPLGPGTWHDTQVTTGGVPGGVLRTCEGGERGFLLVHERPAPREGGEACPDFSEAEVTPLEEALMALAASAVEMPQWSPRPEGTTPAVRETLTVGGNKVPVLRFDQPADVPVRGVYGWSYAQDPWDGALNGLALERRFQTLSDILYRTAKGGKREPWNGRVLAGWGSWLPEATP